eukprot:CAMPEP_0181101202 /NCGR_PEP_ID=MMETSP1071-20121207/13623_1 /TAXON_ID=35127 /ORGANISM="Thalassiosira sp., Strain NH16" /LENGTH=336 /DNA_ID=CAMNT_0023184027 /DNA_START=116 /DNA_END=1126 /DNA_ORIENTATION=+
MIVDRRIFVTALVLIVASFNNESGGGSGRANDGGVSILVSAEEDIHVAQRAIHRRRRTLDEDSKNGGVDIQEQNGDREQRKGFFVVKELQTDTKSEMITAESRKEGHTPRVAEEESSKKEESHHWNRMTSNHQTEGKHRHRAASLENGEEQYDPYLGLTPRGMDHRDLASKSAKSKSAKSKSAKSKSNKGASLSYSFSLSDKPSPATTPSSAKSEKGSAKSDKGSVKAEGGSAKSAKAEEGSAKSPKSPKAPKAPKAPKSAKSEPGTAGAGGSGKSDKSGKGENAVGMTVGGFSFDIHHTATHRTSPHDTTPQDTTPQHNSTHHTKPHLNTPEVIQ